MSSNPTLQSLQDHHKVVHIFSFPDADQDELKYISDHIAGEFMYAGVLIVSTEIDGDDVQTLDVEEFDDWFFDSGKEGDDNE